MTTCTCACHVNPYGWVPVCPRHHLPLHAAEAGTAQCPWRGQRRRQVGGQEFVVTKCVTWAPSSWEWRPREAFNLDDLPPYNGWQEPRYPEPNGGNNWEVHSHRCRRCGMETQHVVGENRSVCTHCGLCSWRPDPAYVYEEL